MDKMLVDLKISATVAKKKLFMSFLVFIFVVISILEFKVNTWEGADCQSIRNLSLQFSKKTSL